jgi:UDP-N-acetylmuramate dehydrogenase
VGDLVTAARVVSRAGVETDVSRGEMSFGYEGSRLRDTGEILLWAEFAIGDGDPAALIRLRANRSHSRKRTQPLDTPSAGCVFRNPQPGRDTVPDASRGLPAPGSIAPA